MPLNAERVWPDGFNGYTFGEPKIDLESEVGRALAGRRDPARPDGTALKRPLPTRYKTLTRIRELE